MYFERADGTANNAAKIHTPKIVATITCHVAFEEIRAVNGFNVALYRWMLNTATEYAERPTDRRRQKGRNVHIKSPSSNVSYILFAQASEKSIVKKMISLIAKLRMYILGRVRMSLLHMIMIRMMTLLIVPNIKGTAYNGISYCLK
jgi:hypothetical protein